MNNDFKHKYLKYKNKYLELKGGANCPRLGFNQYSGQCWNDSFQMIILYSNGISEPIQKIFDDPVFQEINHDGTLEFNPPKDWLEYIKNYQQNKHLLPINIETDNDKDCKRFINEGYNYISRLYKRYHNDKKAISKDYMMREGDFAGGFNTEPPKPIHLQKPPIPTKPVFPKSIPSPPPLLDLPLTLQYKVPTLK